MRGVDASTAPVAEDEPFWAALVSALPDAVIVLRPDPGPEQRPVLRILHVNPAAASTLRVRPDDAVGRDLLEILTRVRSSGFALGVVDRCLGVLRTGRAAPPFRVPADDVGGVVDVRMLPFRDGVVAVARHVDTDVDELETLRVAATHDPLTGLANRIVAVDELERAVATAARTGSTTAVLMLDLDHFKEVNDALGHAVGDDALREAAMRMRDAVRSGELLARIGGDEFVIVVRDVADPLDVQHLVDRLLRAFREPIHLNDVDVWCTLSIGVATTADGASSGDVLFEQADTALYAAKSGGRDRAVYHDDALQQRSMRRSELERDLAGALDRGEFEVHFQPEVDLVTGRTTAVEALLRWRHADGEVADAASFLAIAEETGAIVPIGAWVIATACRQMAARAVPAGAGDAPEVLRVNVSALQLAERHFAEAVEGALSMSGLSPERLTVEFDEEALVRGGRQAVENLARLSRDGVGIVLDDFGRGVTSLGALTATPYRRIKLDASLIRPGSDNRLLRAVVATAAQFGVPVVAEGIETVEQADLARALGCVAAQGHYFSPPLPFDTDGDGTAGDGTAGDGTDGHRLDPR